MRDWTALVIDDEAPARRFLCELVDADGAFRSVRATGRASEALRWSREGAFDVAFVDIRLADGEADTSGLSLARDLAANGATRVVLATASSSHALRGFELGAVDYLLKPFRQARVSRCIQRLRSQRQDPQAVRIVARDGASLRFLDVSSVTAFEARQRLTYVHAQGASYLLDPSLAKLASMLPGRFLRVHRNWLVAADRVQAWNRRRGAITLLLEGGLEIPVSRDRVADVRRRLLEGTVGLARS